MGGILASQVLKSLPADVTAAERLVLNAIAQAIRNESGIGAPGRNEIIALTGFSAGRIGNLLAQLARRGLEVRVPLGTDKTGRPFFAHEGRSTTYDLRPLITDSEGERSTPEVHKRSTDSAERSTPRCERSTNSAERSTPVWTLMDLLPNPPVHDGPQPQDLEQPPSPPKIDTSSRYEAEERRLRAIPEPLRTIARSVDDPTATRDELEAVHHRVIERHHPRNVASYLRSLAAAGALLPLLLEIRSERQSQSAGSAHNRLRLARLEGPWCPHGEAALLSDSGQPLCVSCRRGVRSLTGERMGADLVKVTEALDGMQLTEKLNATQLRNYARLYVIAMQEGQNV